MATTRVFIYDPTGKDISDDVELRNKKSNPFGWSQSEIWWQDKQIGWIESGGFDLNDGFSHKEVIEP